MNQLCNTKYNCAAIFFLFTYKKDTTLFLIKQTNTFSIVSQPIRCFYTYVLKLIVLMVGIQTLLWLEMFKIICNFLVEWKFKKIEVRQNTVLGW